VTDWLIDMLIRAGQVTIALAVSFAAIWFQQTYNYHINGYLVAAWAFMAAYGATYLLVISIERRIAKRGVLPRLSVEQKPREGVQIDLPSSYWSRRDTRRDGTL